MQSGPMPATSTRTGPIESLDQLELVFGKRARLWMGWRSPRAWRSTLSVEMSMLSH